MPSENYEGFEYEDDEDDEGFEDDEDDEDFEDDEDDEADDEAFAFEDDEDDEDDERLDDESEGDEADDEARYGSRRSRRNRQARARAQQRAQARAVVASQKTAARKTMATTQNLQRKIRNIQGAAPIKVKGPGRLSGTGVVTAELPNGRRTKMRISPVPASVRDVNKLASRIASNDKRQARAEAANSRAINRLAAAQAASVKQMAAAQVKSDSQLAKKIADGDARLEKRISSELSGKGGIGASQRKMLMRVVKTQRRRAIWNTITIASALPFFIAYGDRKELFGKNNLILAASLGGWLLADELVDQFTGKGKKEGALATGADVWSYVAPVGNAATAYFLLKDQQHERFITGIETVTFSDGETSLVKRVPIPVGKDFSEDFAKETNVYALATINGKSAVPEITGVKATVEKGELVLTFNVSAATSDDGTVEVAWVVDTQSAA